MAPPSLDALSVELITNVVSQLRSQRDLVNFALTSTLHFKIIEPLIWKDIQFFPPSLDDAHENKEDESLCFATRLIAKQDRRRPVGGTTFPGYEEVDDYRFKILVEVVNSSHGKPLRSSHLTQSLSMRIPRDFEVFYDSKFWAVFASFPRLQSLHLAIYSAEISTPWDTLSSSPALDHLEEVSLYGYVDIGLIKYVLQSSATLKRLEMGIWDHPVPGEHFEEFRDESPTEDDEVQNEDDAEDMYEDNVCPRPFDWIPASIPDDLRLTHLRLCQPSQMDPAEFPWGRMHFSLSAEANCIASWLRLIRAVGPSLEHLVLEQRPAAREDAMEGGDSDNFMEYTAQPSNVRLVNAVLPLFENKELPALKRLDFIGVLVCGSPADQKRRDVLTKICEEGNVECNFHLGRWCLFEFDSGAVSG